LNPNYVSLLMFISAKKMRQSLDDDNNNNDKQRMDLIF
jgi:hypothetical protein